MKFADVSIFLVAVLIVDAIFSDIFSDLCL